MDQIVLNLFGEESKLKPIEKRRNSYLSASLEQAVLNYVNTRKISAKSICEELIKHHNAPKERYTTDKPKLYPFVCLFLDELVVNGELRLVSSSNEDRCYELNK